MSHKHRVILLLLCTLAIFGLSTAQLAAQDEEPAVCTEIMERSFTQMATDCAGSAIGEACYAHSDLSATFNEAVDDDFFSAPGDVASLALLDSLTTADVDIDAETWGLAYVNSQANLPTEVIESLDGKGVLYFVPGGITIEDVTPDENLIVPLAAGIEITTVSGGELRSGPEEIDDGDRSNVIAQIPSETTLNADAVSEDGEWLRVVFEGTPGWMSQSMAPNADVTALVVIGPDTFTAMQAISLSTSEDTLCPSLVRNLIVQGPQDIPVEIQINSIPLRIASSSFVYQDGNSTCFIAWSGLVALFPGTDDEVLVPPGFFACFDTVTGQFTTRGVLEGSQVAPVSPELAAALNQLAQLLPENLLHYLLDLIFIDLPSGVGQPGVTITVPVDLLDDIEAACDAGLLPPAVCEAFGL